MFKPDYDITDNIANNLAEIASLRSQLTGLHIRPEREVEMRYRATVEATHSSTSIEGNPLTDQQVGAVLANEDQNVGVPLTRHRYAEIEVRNYKAALDWIDERKQKSSKLTIDDILTVHRIITDGLLPTSKSGVFRTNQVYMQNEKDEVLYVAADPDKVVAELEALLAWLANDANKVHPVLVAGIFHLKFVSIHPFADGNGRTTRVLTMLYLGLRDYDFDGSLVLDSFYSSDRRAYYRALSQAQGKTYDVAKETSMTHWLEYFVDGFLSSTKVLLATATILSSSVAQLADDIRTIGETEVDILSYVRNFGSITTADAVDIMGGVNARTAQRQLKKMVDAGYLKRIGDARSARYVINNNGGADRQAKAM